MEASFVAVAALARGIGPQPDGHELKGSVFLFPERNTPATNANRA
jgi:hypothetical protein